MQATLEQRALDEIREQSNAGLSPPPERRWFTVAFTADERCA